MHHLCLFTGSIANNSVLADLPPAVDEELTLFSTNTLTYSDKLKILRSYAMGDSITRVQYDSPRLRLIGPPVIQPIDAATSPSTLAPINRPDVNGLNWFANDPLGIKLSRAGAAAATCKALLWLSGVMPQPVTGPIRRVRATAAITATQTGWTSGPITFDQALPSGRYDIVGMAAQGTNLFAVRFILPGQRMRPGVLAQATAGEWDWEWFRNGVFGLFGSFNSWAPPTIQVHAFGANTAQEVWLDLIPRNVPGMASEDLAM